jgi:hypothetical protein
MQKYPIGIQSFKELRGGNYVYVDKTQVIHELVDTGKYYFLSRPRRFGKSLLVSTLKELYEGNEALFKGLWIENHWDFTKTNPTIVLYFNQMSFRDTPLLTCLLQAVDYEAERFDIVLESSGIGYRFAELIKKIYKKTGEKVTVLIDEYDKPIVDFLDKLDVVNENRDILKSFYGVLKPLDEYLEFVLMTGVSQFPKLSVFSDLNNLNDISLDRQFSAIVGITQTELESIFKNEIVSLSEEAKMTASEYLEKIKFWYNGYGWKGEKVYNPFSLLNFFRKGEFDNYWFSTGTPTWLLKQVYDKRIYDFEEIQVSPETLNSLDFQHINPITLLFQTGYLTIKEYVAEDYVYILGLPNQEVRYSLNNYLLKLFNHAESEDLSVDFIQLRNALQNHDLEKVVEVINTLFSTLPYDLWQKENERFYHALIHITFTILGVYVKSEVHSSRGRCDAIVQTKDYIYAFEFKLEKTAQEALNQIEAKDYLAPYQQSPKQRIAVGVNFSIEKKGISEWLEKVL